MYMEEGVRSQDLEMWDSIRMCGEDPVQSASLNTRGGSWDT